jgi:SagB-type dehydrogenase family enzyme
MTIALWLTTGLLTLQTVEFGDTVRLPAPREKGEISIEESLAKRRSVRSFTRQPLTIPEISQLLWAAQGITDTAWGLRTAPSAGALYPLEVFVVLPAGVYHYDPRRHMLKRTVAEDMRKSLEGAALGQECIGDAPAVFVIAAVFERTAVKYGSRATRYVYLEAGHACQNLLLQATALGLGGVPVGAFYDDQVARLLQFDKDVKPLYLVPIGHAGG